MSEQVVIGRLDEDVILPCSFESGPDIVIHWKNQDNYYLYSYYKESDQLEKQDPKFINRTSLFHGQIHNGNASLSFRRLSLQDEGIYVCYVGTSSRKKINKVVLKVGAFVTPVMKYEKKNTNSFLICNVLSVYPYPIITWKVDDTPISENSVEEVESLGAFCINSGVNITRSNSSYQCAIENTLLKQTWRGKWTMKDFVVTWSKVGSETSSVLAYFLNSSQKTVVNEPRLSWNKELINRHNFSLTLKDLSLSDSGEYLCNISSSNYTLLTIQTLHVEVDQRTVVRIILPILVAVLAATLVLSVVTSKLRRCICSCPEEHSTNQRSCNAGTAEETRALSDHPASIRNEGRS
ncbi:HERV-H LTR-associating protein 2 isoform X5 [Sus scrofa]|nr:HERV-H LTR-associating protein 2 isoform X5 [Sus scrofa]XP_020926107.1 HERV-H LTR-associating protein 2 isoform X5 [Sus scrofa]XP_020926108.1 HERV-H LTR-associating protein 2 isoform X5 [Sus scrofa]XP_020926110.1 HERV-H LTR-associating protein 2 isoform X5 [Sus scrofa]